MIQLSIIGNLGKDAEIKEFNSEKFLSFSVAHSRSYKMNDGTKVESTTWLSCTTRQISLAPYLKKGMKVFCQGNPSTKVYQNQKGEHLAELRLSCQNIELLSSSKKKEAEAQVPDQNPAPVTNGVTNGQSAGDDLPF